MTSNTAEPRSFGRHLSCAKLLAALFFAVAALLATTQAEAQAFGNDFFANAFTIFGPQGSIQGNTIGATRETNEPIHYVTSPESRRSVWFHWVAPQDGLFTFDTAGSAFDTILAVYRRIGTNTSITNLVRVASDDDSAHPYPLTNSLVRFTAVADAEYFIALDGYNQGFGGLVGGLDSGPYVLNWTAGERNPLPVLEGVIRFASTNFVVNENGGVALITVWFGGDPSFGGGGPVSVDFFTSDFTAVDGTHYGGTNGTLVFAPGETTKTIEIPILDNALLNSHKIAGIELWNPTNATLDVQFSSASVTITDNEAPLMSAAGGFTFGSTLFIGTENETLAAPFGPPASSRDVPSFFGVQVTVNRIGGSTGRVMVDWFTTSNTLPATGTILPAKQGTEYIVSSGTLVFDDFQTSASFIIPVFSDGISNNASKQFEIVLANPRAAEEEDLNAPDLIVPYLGGFGTAPRASVRIIEVNERFRSFSIERAVYRFEEYNPNLANGPYVPGQRNVTVDVILPGAGGGSVSVRAYPSPDRYTSFVLQPGSDYADYDTRTFPDTAYTDGTAPIVNTADIDFVEQTITFPPRGPGSTRQRVTFTITNDSMVEFNEDVRIELRNIPDGFSAINAEATATILFDDQPAGAVDREWNPPDVARTQPPFNNTPGANNTVFAVAVQPDNRTVLGGDFTAVNSISRNRIARLNQDGSLDLSFNPGTGADGTVEAVVIYTNISAGVHLGKILIGGHFTSVNGVRRNSIARLNANGSLDTTFRPGNGADGPIHSVVLQSDNKILVAGEFSHFNDIPVNGIMRLNEDGTLDTTFNAGAGANGIIWSMAVRDTSQTIFAPRTAVGTELEDVNEIDTGSTAGELTIDYDFQAIPDNIRVFYDGVMVFDLTTNNTGRITLPYGPGNSTSVTIIMNQGIGIPGTLWAYRAFVRPVIEGRTIYVGGEFTSFDGQRRIGLARLLDDGSVDPAFDPGIGPDGAVFSVALQANNRLLIGGAFRNYHTQARSGITRLLSNGSLDTSYHTGSGVDGSVRVITLQADGKALIGGPFTSFNGTRRMGMARLFERGPLDTSFLDTAYNQFAGLPKTFSFDPPRFVNSIALDTNGHVMIGGSFTNLGGNYSYDRSLDRAFLTLVATQLYGGTIYAPFTRADKSSRFNVARLIGGYTPGPGNLEFDPNAMPFAVDENAGSFFATVRRVDGRLGSGFLTPAVTNITTEPLEDIATFVRPAVWPEWTYVAPRSVGFPGLRYVEVPIIDDSLREGDETFGLDAALAYGSITLGGELIPLGAAKGYFDQVPVTITDQDFDHGVFTFAVQNFYTNENAATAVISVNRTNGSSGSVTVDYLVLNGTAINGQDYSAPASARRLTFGPGQTNRTFTISLLDNPAVEPDETVLLVLTNATGGATLPGGLVTSTATATLTIIDNDFLPGRLNVASATYSASEADRSVTVTVTRTGGALGSVSVNYDIVPGTATPGDYTPVSGTLVWNNGDTSARTVTIPLAMDGQIEGSETFTFRLFNPQSGALGGQSNAVVTILDADRFGVLSLSQSEYFVGENEAPPIITVLRRDGSSGTVTVNYSTTPGTAVAGADYQATSGTLTFGPGELRKTFQVPIINNDEENSPRTFFVELSAATGATLGTITSAAINIVDDESLNIPAGSLDTEFSATANANGAVYAVALQTDGAIVMAGDFTEVGSVPRSKIARLTSNGLLDPTFDIGPGANGSIRALALQSDSRLIVGGFFTTINGTNRSGLARLNTDGKVDISFDPGAGADNPVFAVAIQGDDKVLAGGSFSTFRGVSSPGLVRLNTNGTLDATFSVGAGFNGTIYAVEVQFDGKILVGGNFISYNGEARTNLVRLNSDGTLDLTFNPSLHIDAPVRAILPEADGGVVIGGSFGVVNGQTRSFLARLTQTGALDPNFLSAPGSGANNVVYTIEQQVDGKLIVGGDFTVFNGVTRRGITRLNSNGTTDPTINFGSGANAFVAAVVIQPDRKIILGGGFTEYDGEPRSYLARIYGGSIAGSGGLEFDKPLFRVSESETNSVVLVRRRGGTAGTVSVDFTTADITAVTGLDYLATARTLTFAEGETFQAVDIPIIPNSIPDGDRIVGLILNNFVGASEGLQPLAQLVILDDESTIRFTSAEYSVSEDPVSGNATIGVFRNGGTNSLASVQFTVASGTATPGLDYIATNGTLTFLPGQVFLNFNVPIINDSLAEGNETLSLHLTAPSANATISIGDAQLVIVDNDFAPGEFVFSTNSFTGFEADGVATITVIRTNGSSGSVSVRLRSSNGSAQAGPDYVAVDRVVNFADGETVKFVPVTLVNNNTFEPDETFFVTLSQPTGGSSILSSSATVTIVDDEFGPSFVGFASTNFTGSEPEGFATMSVVRTNSRRGVVTVNYSMSNGTATAADYTASSGTLVFADGEILQTILVPLANDGLAEVPETVNLTLSGVTGGFLGLSTSTLTIYDSQLPVQFAETEYVVSESAGTARITVLRREPFSGSLSVNYLTGSSGTAVGGRDYTPVVGTLTWADGDASPRTFTVPLTDNNVLNPARTVVLILSNAVGTANALLTIADDEGTAPTAGPVDPLFNGNYGANATVRAVAYDAEERLYVAGDFTQLYGLHINRVARLATNGAVDLTFDPGTGADAPVYGLARAQNGVVIGGAFTNVNGVARRGLARLLVDGSVDAAFNPGSGANGPVYGVAVPTNQQVFVVGDFTSVNGSPATRIARLNPDGSIDPAFALGSGANAAVRAVALQTNGQILIGGDFTSVNGFVVSRIARLNANGVLDTSFGSSLGADGAVHDIEVQLDGKIVVAGSFQTLNGAPRPGVARLNTDGSVDFSFNPVASVNGLVRSVIVQPDGRIVLGGDFTHFDGIPVNGIARLNSDGSLDAGFESGTGVNGSVHSLAVADVTSSFVIPRQATGTALEDRLTLDVGATSGTLMFDYDFGVVPNNLRVYYGGGVLLDLTTNGLGRIIVPFGPGNSSLVTVIMNEGNGQPGAVWAYTLTVTTGARLDNRIALGGNFTRFNGEPRGGVAVLNSDGSLNERFNPAGIPTRSVLAVALHTNTAQASLVGKWVVGGDFTAIVGVNNQNRVARLNIDGTLDRSFATGRGADNVVRAVALQADGKVIIGGAFTSYDFIPRAYVARMNVDGTLDNTFNSANNGANINNPVHALALQADGKVVIGGSFTTVYGASRNSIARLNTNGTVDVSFSVGTGANGPVNAVVVQPDGRILIAGDFTQVNGTPRLRIARLNANGSLDSSFNPGTGADAVVNALALTADGDVLVGGAFVTMGGVTSPRLARLNADGSVDSGFNPGSGANGPVSAIVVQPDGNIVVGGYFTLFNGQVRNRIVRLTAGGALDPSVNFGTGANDYIAAVGLQDYDGKIVVGGGFTRFDELPRVGIARLFGGTNVGAGTFHFSASTYRVSEGSNSVQIPVVRSGGLQGTVSVNYSTANGSAVAPGDYTVVSGTLTFAPAENVKYITVPVVDNPGTNADKTFTVTLFSPTGGASLGEPALAEVIVEDNDSVLGFASSSFSVNENGGTARITVARSGGVSDLLTVDYATVSGGTATDGQDYTGVAGSLAFAPGVRTQSFEVPILDDTVAEFDETVQLVLRNVRGAAALAQPNATLTIVENDFNPGTIVLATNSVFFSEDAVFVTLELFRTNGHSGVVSVNFNTANGTAIAGSDYVATNGVVFMADGQTNTTVTLRLIDDVVQEGNETFLVQFLNPSGGATIGTPVVTVNIVDNDAPGQFVFASPTYTVSEGGSFATITVLRTNGNQGAVSVNVQSSGGTATPGVDYGAVNTILTFANGQTARSFNVPIQQDALVEGTETVNFLLANQTGGASIGVPQTATLSIQDDEVAVEFSVAAYSVTESLTNVVVNVVRIGDTNASFSVTASTADGTATSADYVPNTVLLTFAPGQVTNSFTVAVLDDTSAEGNESLTLTLSSPSAGVTLGANRTATLSILDNDSAFVFSSANYQTNEANVDLVITVLRLGFQGATSAVDFATFDGTAVTNLDYLQATGRLAFAVGQTSVTFNVRILDDLLVEGNETINLVLGNPQVPAAIGPQATAIITILDNDATVGFAPTSYVVNEKVGGVSVTVVRNGAATQPVSVTFRTANGNALAGLDYTAVNTTVSWAANDLSPKTVIVPITDDNIAEGSETVNLQLVNPVGAFLDPATGAGTISIVDNGGVFAFSAVSYSATENGGNALLTIVRSGGANGNASVNWSVTGGSASPGVDYAGISGTVVFASNETVKPLILPILDDLAQEGIETVVISLSAGDTLARIGTPSQATLSITDDEAGLIVGTGAALVSESYQPTNSIIEPGETVTVLLGLRNAGTVDAGNVTATLVYGNGVTGTSPQTQNYGALLAGGNSESRQFTFTASGTNGSRITATLAITNNGLFLGFVTFDFVLGQQNIPFQNAGAITIRDGTFANPYPAQLTVSGVAGAVTKLSVTLYGYSHGYPEDVDMLLVGPNGVGVMLMSDAGGGTSNALNNVQITFDDEAAEAIPFKARITNGVYRPANHLTVSDPMTGFPSNTQWSNTSLSSFNGINPNGVWSLYIMDDASSQAGQVSGGWSLNIGTSQPIIAGSDLSVVATDAPDPVTFGSTVTYTVAVTNHGPSAATSVLLTNILPVNATFLTVAGPGSFSQNGNVLVGNLGNIPVGGTAVITVQMTAPNATALLTFDSSVGAAQQDLNGGNNRVSIKTTVSETPAPPALFAALKNGQMVLSWASNSSNVVLQTSGSLGSTWSRVLSAPTVSNGVSTVTVPATAGPKFFRLQRVP
jgi:uncharacterized delta-60 repeat protein/uncharacterized repeat protein (TIGR01451 family)